MDVGLQDLRNAFRAVVRKPGFTLVAVLTLAIGIGSSTAIFSIVNGVILRPLPYPDASRLVYLGVRATDPMPFFATSMPDFIDWKDRVTSLERLGALQPTSVVIAGDGEAQRVQATRISPDVIPLLGMALAAGRTFSDEEFRTGAEPVVILSHGLWQRRWGGDPTVVGRRLTTVGDGAARSPSVRVIGVLQSDPSLPSAAMMPDPEMWMPLAVDGPAYASSRTNRTLRVIGRLEPGVTLEAARQEAEIVATAMAAEFPDAYRSDDRILTIGIASLLTMTVGDTGDALLILLGATGFLLLIGCANVANLLLARATEREKEMALRSALGAGRSRILRQLLTESVVLGLLGGVAGVGIAHACLAVFQVLGPADFPRMDEVTLDLRVLSFALALALLTGILFGLAPAVAGSRANSAGTLKGGSSTTTSGLGQSRLRGGLIVAETALALVLLCGAGLLIVSYQRLQSVAPGCDPEGLLMSEIGLNDSHSTQERRAAYFRDLLNAVRVLPGVEAVSTVADPPMSGYTMWAPGVLVEGAGDVEPRALAAHLVGPDYAGTMGIEVIRGRDISPRDDSRSQGVVLVSETVARQLWPGQDPIGRRIRLSDEEAPWLEVVGLVRDIRQDSLSSPSDGEIYIPYAQNAWYKWMYLVVRTTTGAAAMAGPLRQVMRDVDPSVPFDGLVSMSDRIEASLNAPRFNAFLLTVFASMALLLAVGGIFATMLYAVKRRTREMAIRMAIGARPHDVVGLVVRQGMALALAGVVVGIAGTLALSRTLSGLVFDVSTTDPATLLAVTGLLLSVALVACYLPARSATRVEPTTALRSE